MKAELKYHKKIIAKNRSINGLSQENYIISDRVASFFIPDCETLYSFLQE